MPDATAIVTCMTDAERPFLRETLKSVYTQTVPCEIIVVVLDSNSWIDAMVGEFPGTQIIRRPLGWLGAVRNTGIEAASCEFVAFLDGDDVWLPTKIQRQIDFLRTSHQDFVAVDHMLITEAGKVFAFALARHLPMPSSWMVRRQTMLQHPFNPELPTMEDADWWFSTWHSVRKWRLPEPLIRYRVRGQSLSAASASKRRKLAFARMSSMPAARPLLLAATYVMHRLSRRTDYVPAKDWTVPPAPELRDDVQIS